MHMFSAKEMKRVSLVSVVFSVFLFTSFAMGQYGDVVAREVKASVEIGSDKIYALSSARIEKVVMRQSDGLKERLQLTVHVPEHNTFVNGQMLVLTSYRKTGKVLGKFILPLSEEDFFSAKKTEGSLTFELDPVFEEGTRFILDIIDKDSLFSKSGQAELSTTCEECVGLANDTCGRGRVASVKCGATREGSCEFTCKP